jgi:hypothetical protein
MSQLSRQCGILKISQPYSSPRPVTGIALLFLLFRMHYSDSKSRLQTVWNTDPKASPTHLYSASIRNEYRKHKKKFFWGVKCGWCVGLTTIPPSMSQLSRQCGILKISQPYSSPRPVTGITLLFLLFRMHYSDSKSQLQTVWNTDPKASPTRRFSATCVSKWWVAIGREVKPPLAWASCRYVHYLPRAEATGLIL